MDISVPKKTRTRKTREQRTSEIIGVATQVFTHEGYSELTLRRVAKELKIRLSTVQYYFESKEQLVLSMLTDRINFYRNELLLFQDQSEGDSFQQFTSYIKYLLDDNEDPETTGFFTQLWAMGYKDEECRSLLDYMYSTHRHDLALLIQAVKPDLCEIECLRRATLVSSMIEGALIHIGYGSPRRPEFEGIKSRFMDQIVRISLDDE